MLETNVEVMPFIDSLTENTTRGFAQASVYGAKTPNSEWEYLTGNTMAFLPEGSVCIWLLPICPCFSPPDFLLLRANYIISKLTVTLSSSCISSATMFIP